MAASFPTTRPGLGIRWDDIYVDQYADNIDDLNTRTGVLEARSLELGYAEITAASASFTTLADVASLTVTFSLSVTTKVFLMASILLKSTLAADKLQAHITDSANTAVVIGGVIPIPANNDTVRSEFSQRLSLAAGSYTYKVRAERVTGSGTATVNASATNRSWMGAYLIG